MVFRALRGEEGVAECFWPVPLEEAEPAMPRHGDQLALLGHNASAAQALPRLRTGLGKARPRGPARETPDTSEGDATLPA